MKIFLDIDGVMVHAIPNKKVEFESDGFYKFYSSAIDALNLILKTDDEIILSTSHRFNRTIDEWKEIFKNRKILIENLSIIDLPANNLKKDNILNWIQKNKFDFNDILIIDDDKSLNDLPQKLKERLILTNPYTGLTAS